VVWRIFIHAIIGRHVNPVVQGYASRRTGRAIRFLTLLVASQATAIGFTTLQPTIIAFRQTCLAKGGHPTSANGNMALSLEELHHMHLAASTELAEDEGT